VTDLPTLSTDYTPPSDPHQLIEWLGERTEEFAAECGRVMRQVMQAGVDAYIGSLTSLAAAGDPGMFAEGSAKWDKFADQAVAKHVGGMYLAGAQSAYTGAATAHTMIPANVTEPWVVQVNDQATAYMNKAKNRVKGVGQADWMKLRGAVNRGLKQGWDGERLIRELQKQVDMSEFRADTIGRTETVGAYVNGDHLGAAALGQYGPVEHVWIAAIDKRTRPDHASASSQCVKFSEPFIVGGVTMMHPHDGSAPAEQIVNCRCVEQHLYEGDRRPDGSTVEAPAVVAPPPPPEWEPPPFTGGHLQRAATQPALVQQGAHSKWVVTDSNGTEYLFKPQEPWVAHGEVFSNTIARRAGMDLPEMWVHELDGKIGTLQRMVPNARSGFPGSQHSFDPLKLTKADLDTLQEHRVLDWLIGNHDAHAGQFVRQGYASSGGKLTGIDKGQAFKYWGKSEKLDWKFHPNSVYGEANPVHNLVERAYAEGKLDHFTRVTKTADNHLTQLLKRFQGIDDDEYRAMLRPYAKGRYAGKADDIEAFLDSQVARKNGLLDDFAKYHQRLEADRIKALPKPPPAPKAPPGGPGGPKGMTGAMPSKSERAFMELHDSPYKPGQSVTAIKQYTGSSYSEINRYLRGKGLSDTGRQLANKMDEQFKGRVLKSDMIIHRRTTIHGIDPTTLQGTVLVDHGYVSTAAGGPAFSGEITMNIRANAGTPAMWVQDISLHPHEREVILGRGAHFYVHAVRKTGYGWEMDVEVVGENWVKQAGVKLVNPAKP
jgi:hypothetical protein